MINVIPNAKYNGCKELNERLQEITSQWSKIEHC